jgi:hypothetical protein
MIKPAARITTQAQQRSMATMPPIILGTAEDDVLLVFDSMKLVSFYNFHEWYPDFIKLGLINNRRKSSLKSDSHP